MSTSSQASELVSDDAGQPHEKEFWLQTVFELGPRLGKGSFSVVYSAVHIETKQPVALKVIRRSKLKSIKEITRLERECLVMESLMHPNIVRLHSVFQDEINIYLSMQRADGCDLLEYILSREERRLQEWEVRHFFLQVTSAVACAHRNYFIHRDLKLENIFIKDLSCKHKEVLVGDWGFAGTYHPKHRQRDFCGSIHYAAPEMWRRKSYIGPEVDVWSLGVLLFAMITGKLPFRGATNKDTYQLVISITYAIPDFVSPLLTDLISRILVPPKRRLSLQQVMEHDWVVGPRLRSVQHALHSIPVSVYNPETQQTTEVSLSSMVEHESARAARRVPRALSADDGDSVRASAAGRVQSLQQRKMNRHSRSFSMSSALPEEPISPKKKKSGSVIALITKRTSRANSSGAEHPSRQQELKARRLRDKVNRSALRKEQKRTRAPKRVSRSGRSDSNSEATSPRTPKPGSSGSTAADDDAACLTAAADTTPLSARRHQNVHLADEETLSASESGNRGVKKSSSRSKHRSRGSGSRISQSSGESKGSRVSKSTSKEVKTPRSSKSSSSRHSRDSKSTRETKSSRSRKEGSKSRSRSRHGHHHGHHGHKSSKVKKSRSKSSSHHHPADASVSLPAEQADGFSGASDAAHQSSKRSNRKSALLRHGEAAPRTIATGPADDVDARLRRKVGSWIAGDRSSVDSTASNNSLLSSSVSCPLLRSSPMDAFLMKFR
mmetsp:Transcript_38844/g.97863  ORF Transcript_38844/g.97863 Transcript_38844/m.97863 type:complete len:723 (+) Transcript_38844:257-2425(+)|eukprot:CAMPEP_0177644074 /NCGR_PEP_ID=MMETSP0447-20121125/8485_1 /TAXON_ID=0 /ORGANISM="Stygamoeba regulata, Strain BSH-02190019" /LENGTH=722 /DNA_ID=CAMNT_0019146393 /DNA_START=301 /DNA_END=2469 /DNA_ORIENTATION=-